MELIERLRRKAGEFPVKGATLVVAVSGGVDSVALLHLLLPLAAEYEWEMVVAHLNHQLRRAAGADARFVEKLAKSLGLKSIINTSDVKKLAKTNKLTIEEAGRVARYKFLRRVSARYKKSIIVTAHTADDQLETVVMNWLRGASVRGMVGMKELEKDIWRPLLSVPKTELIEFAKKFSINYREDKTNQDTKYTRNLIRHKIIPMLSKVNPNLRAMALRGSGNFSRLEIFLDNSVRDLYKKVIRRSRSGTVTFDLVKFKALDPFIQDELILYAVDKLKGSRQNFKQVHLLEAHKIITSFKKVSYKQLPGKLFLIKAYDKISISRYRPKDL